MSRSKKRWIRIQAEQLVKYDQTFEMTEEEFQEFEEANRKAREGDRLAVQRLADLADSWLDKSNVSDARDIDGDEVEIEAVVPR